ncbi:MAG: hypothetical protein O2892_12085 [Actinomycetota bacterium]|nr:hypothetical protein [Actinomycetota bacterium]MDA2949761.1 hypothetical protein [Actinomycetota bacterium]
MEFMPQRYAGYGGYRTVVWEIVVLDPDRCAIGVVGEQTDFAAACGAEVHGCEYEYCVDDDELFGGVKYYKWYVRIPQSQHSESRLPEVIVEVMDRLKEVLPAALSAEGNWSAGAAEYPSYKRAVSDYFRSVYPDLLDKVDERFLPLRREGAELMPPEASEVAALQDGSLIVGYVIWLCPTQSGCALLTFGAVPEQVEEHSSWSSTDNYRGRPVLIGPRPPHVSWQWMAALNVEYLGHGIEPYRWANSDPDKLVEAVESDLRVLIPHLWT